MSFVNDKLLADSVFAGAPGELSTARPALRLVDAEGHAIVGATIRWTVIGDGARVARYNERTTSDGEASTDWYLGTNATQPQQLVVEARKGGARALLVLTGSARPTRPLLVRAQVETTTVDLGVPAAIAVIAIDRYGNEFRPQGVAYRVVAGTTVEISQDGRPVGVSRGASSIEARVDSLTDTAVVRVVQRVASIGTVGSTRLNAIGSTIVVRMTLTDVNGRAVLDSAPVARSEDTTIARVVQLGDSILIRSIRRGLTTLTLTVGSLRDRSPILVNQVVASASHTPDALAFAALGDTATVVVRAIDSSATSVTNAVVTLAARNPAVAGVDASGAVHALANGTTQVVISIDGVARDSLPVTVRQVPVAIAVARDTLIFTAFGASQPLDAHALDARGRVIDDVTVTADARDAAIAAVRINSVVAVGNGSTTIALTAGLIQRDVGVEVRQRVARIIPASGSIELTALAARAAVGARAVDSLGNFMTTVVAVTAAMPSVLRVVGADSIEAVAPGTTSLTLMAGDCSLTVPVTVWQRPDHIAVDETRFAQPIAVVANARIAAGAVVLDANGYPIVGAPLDASVDDAAVAAVSARDTIIIIGSGATTLRLRSGILKAARPLRVYLPPELAARRIAATFDADTALGNPWAPTLTTAPDGQVRLYFAAYKNDSTVQFSRANLAYLTSADTTNFHYAGTAIAHQPLVADPYGWGVENVVVVPRSDGSGMRMYFSGGSNTIGWQVFSAVGDGVGQWTVESGVRVGSGPLNLYPQGEGMVVLPDAAGGLRMILGSMQLASGQANSWAIVEFHSADGIQWDYARAVLRPGAPGSGTERAVYSPTIVPFGKGAWRMFYTGDDLNRAPDGGKSQIWSAVSFDLATWVVEGVIIPAVDGNLFYASALGDKVAYVRTPSAGGVNKIEIARMIQR